jgi:hypothetical protein
MIWNWQFIIAKVIIIFVCATLLLINKIIAFFYFIGRELKDTIIVAYLLEYYSQHAMEDPGWMTTVSKALPLLFKYHYGLLFN